MVYTMVYIMIYTIWYITYGTYHWTYGIYQLKVVYTMTVRRNLPDAVAGRRRQHGGFWNGLTCQWKLCD